VLSVAAGWSVSVTTELKTLKDMDSKPNSWCKPCQESNRMCCWCMIIQTRAEGVKWIKAAEAEGHTVGENASEVNAIIIWIKRFFNITDEDLK